MKRILFHTNQIDVRGTCNALFYYALYNQTILNNKSYIITQNQNQYKSDEIAVAHFKKNFDILYYNDLKSLESYIDSLGIDIVYYISYGKRSDTILSTKVKNVIHCVFDMSEPFGDVYAGVSKALASKFNKTLYVPHMIGLFPLFENNNLRDFYNIPTDATVFGRHGGTDTFNIPFCMDTIVNIVTKFDKIFFLLVNTHPFYSHKQIIHIEKIVEDYDKRQFINTCDAHIECGTLGHSFGISIGEFSVFNKPCICFDDGTLWNRSHIDILKDKGLYYKDSESFYNTITTFDKNIWALKDNNAYREYNPHDVMQTFKKVFID